METHKLAIYEQSYRLFVQKFLMNWTEMPRSYEYTNNKRKYQLNIG